jgi:hypothetical protein
MAVEIGESARFRFRPWLGEAVDLVRAALRLAITPPTRTL